MVNVLLYKNLIFLLLFFQYQRITLQIENFRLRWKMIYTYVTSHLVINKNWRKKYRKDVHTRLILVLFFHTRYKNVLFYLYIQYRQRQSVINHCDRCIALLGDLDISFVLLNMSSKFHLHLECYIISPKRHIKISK